MHSSHDITRAADLVLTDRLQRAVRSPFERRAAAARPLCFPCMCRTERCYRCMLPKSALRSAQRAGTLDLACPVCDQHGDENGPHTKRGRHSSHVAAFAATVWALYPRAVIVWDWNCVVNDSKMSIDATVLSGHGCAQFEVDGGVHFEHNLANRTRKDVLKDEYICEQKLPVLRLHYRDQNSWVKYIVKHVTSTEPGVQYTQAYQECLQGDELQQRVMKL